MRRAGLRGRSLSRRGPLGAALALALLLPGCGSPDADEATQGAEAPAVMPTDVIAPKARQSMLSARCTNCA